jgi:hypothetical protein
VYFNGPAARIRSLTIRGSGDNGAAGASDNDNLVIDGDLGLGPAQNGNVTVVGGGGNNTFEVYGNQQVVAGGNGTVTVNGAGNSNTLEIDDSDYAGSNVRYRVTNSVVTGTDTAGANRWTVNYAGINTSLEVDGGTAYNQWLVASTPACETTLNTGTGPNDSQVQTTTGPLNINGESGIDTVQVGNAGSLQDIRGDLDVTNSGGLTSLSLDDSADRTARNNVVLTAFTLSGLSPALISWTARDINNLNISGGTGGNTFTVRTTPPGVAAAQATINTGTGTDTVNVLATQRKLTINGQRAIDSVSLGNAGSVQGIQGAVNVTNAAGLTSLSIDDSADNVARNVTLNNTTLSGLAPADISWTPGDINNLGINGGSAGNTFTVFTTPSGVPAAQATLNTGTGNDTVGVQATQRSLTINGQGGRDQVSLGKQGNAQGIVGNVSVTNANGSTALTIDDSADQAPCNATLNATSLQGLAPGQISWVAACLSSLVIKGGVGGNTFTVFDTPRNNVPVTTTLSTGGGNDTTTVRGAKGPLIINGQAGNDRIRFLNFADTATVDGGPDNDTIEAAQGTLSTSQVPFTNVENLAVTGGSTLNVNTDVSTGTILVQQGTLALQGGIPTVTNSVQIQAQGVLTGTGTINGTVQNAGQVFPAGAGAVGRITVRDDYVQGAGGTLNLDLQGPQPGTQSDNLEVGHAVQLSGTLNLNPLAHFNGDTFELVTNRGNDAVNGIFAGLPEGTVVKLKGQKFQITYLGGEGNDVVLHPVAQVGTTTGVNSSVNPSVFGQLVTFTATVSALTPGPVPPTGTVTFMDGNTPLGTGTLAVIAGVDQATWSTAALAVATHPITAVYAGDGTFPGSTSGILNQVVNKASTSTVVAVTGSPSYGQSVSFTATVTAVSPGSGTPTGTVQFQVDGTNLGTPVSLTAGQAASASLSTLSAGPHTINAVYSGDGNFLTSTGANSLMVAPAPLTITADNKGKVYGAPLPALTASYSGFVNGDTAASLTTAPTLVTTASPSGSVGSYPITASGAVDPNYTISYVAGTLTVSQAGTSTTVAANSSTSVFGEPITFTATVAPVAPGAGSPTGTVAFKRLFPDGSSVTFGTGTLDATGTAVFVMDHFVPATATVFAVYLGDGNFTGSTSPTITHAINPASTTLTVSSSTPASSSSTPTSVAGQGVTFSTTLTVIAPGSAVVPPTGTITFYDTFQGSTTVLTTISVGGSGSTPVFTKAGTHVITAVYSGDGNFNGSTSAAINQVVTPATATHFDLEVAQSTIYLGQPFAMSVTALDDYGNIATGYLGTVHFTNSDPLGAVPPNATFTGSGQVTVSGFTLVSPADATITATDTVNPSLSGSVFFQYVPF